jgi:excisionase family DNA binding protein
MENQITTSVAAQLIGCSEGRVRQLLRAGLLRGARIGRDWLVDRADAERVRDEPKTETRGYPRGRARKGE